MRIYNRKANKEIKNYLIATKNKIDVKAGNCRFNYRCQYNAVHEAIENNQDKIAMCVYLHGEYPIIHFLNIGNNGEFVDNTLGHWSSNHDYFLIKYINKEDYFDVDKIFDSYRREIRKNLTFFTRLMSNTEF
jgi:hypothetical protein